MGFARDLLGIWIGVATLLMRLGKFQLFQLNLDIPSRMIFFISDDVRVLFLLKLLK